MIQARLRMSELLGSEDSRIEVFVNSHIIPIDQE